MIDAIGQEISVDDTVFYGQTGRYADFMVAKVIRLTPKTVVVQKVAGSRSWGDATRICDTSHCVVITKLVKENI